MGEADGWADGWWAVAGRRPSPNADARPVDAVVDLLVVHSISLPPGEYGSDDVERLFMNRLDPQAHPYFEAIASLRVSSHFLIRRDGAMLQFVSCHDRAWHAGVSSWRGRTACNDYSVGVELEGLEGTPFAGVQYDALVRLAGAICTRYPLAWVAGHEHVAPGRKGDPGRGFDWNRLRGMARKHSLQLAADVCDPTAEVAENDPPVA